MPVKYSELSLDTLLCFTIYYLPTDESSAKPLAGTTMRLFSEKSGQMRRGRRKLNLWPHQPADSSHFNCKTPSMVTGITDELDRLERLSAKYERGDLPRSDWLDSRLLPQTIEAVRQVLYIILIVIILIIIFRRKR